MICSSSNPNIKCCPLVMETVDNYSVCECTERHSDIHKQVTVDNYSVCECIERHGDIHKQVTVDNYSVCECIEQHGDN